uniref:Uncharacterized protein n=1 Tax=Anguilla anguilla TaxID=7936 RepID=A0A0E9S7Y5_ANGAN
MRTVLICSTAGLWEPHLLATFLPGRCLYPQRVWPKSPPSVEKLRDLRG